MPTENLAPIIARAASDAQFRELLFAQPAAALAEYKLSDEEMQLLANLTRETFDAAASELEARVSRGGFGTLGSLDTLLTPIRKP